MYARLPGACRSRHNQYVAATRRRRRILHHAGIALGIMQSAQSEHPRPRDPMRMARGVTEPIGGRAKRIGVSGLRERRHGLVARLGR